MVDAAASRGSDPSARRSSGRAAPAIGGSHTRQTRCVSAFTGSVGWNTRPRMLQPPLATSFASSARRTKAVSMRANHTFPDIMQSVRFLIAILVATQAWSAAALEAGQACRPARNWLERTLCGNAPLRQRDADLDQDFRRLLESAPRVARPSLAADQRQWRSALRSCRRRSQPLSCLQGRFEGRAAALRQHPDTPESVMAPSLPMDAGAAGIDRKSVV